MVGACARKAAAVVQRGSCACGGRSGGGAWCACACASCYTWFGGACDERSCLWPCLSCAQDGAGTMAAKALIVDAMRRVVTDLVAVSRLSLKRLAHAV